MTRPLFLRRDYGRAVLVAGLILMAAGFSCAAVATGWFAHRKYGPKPDPIVIHERVLVPVACEAHYTCTKNEALEYRRICFARRYSELTKPKG